MAIKFNGSFTVINDTPNPDVKLAPAGAGSFSFSCETGSELKARLAEVLQPMIDAEAAHLADLQTALAQANT